ncbi:MAG: UMP kinase [Alphaproteobacteria bacterium]|nr:MAG: UMP kinase [Alphaproteobacteria bacterium]
MTTDSRRYKRVMIKLSGGAIAGDQEIGFDQKSIEHIVSEVMTVKDQGIEVSIVIGGGNIFRGNLAAAWGIERADADYVGMLGTVVNSLMLRGALKARTPHDVRVMTAINMDAVAEPFIRLRAIHHMEKGAIVIMAGGIGQPYLTTDYTAVQRALETRCDAILVAKQGVDGVYTADPKKNPAAKRYRTLAYDDFILEKLHIMDHSSLLLARDHALPIHIFSFAEPGCMERICGGEDMGTYIDPNTSMQTV